MSSSHSNDSPSFFKTELLRALSEQTFGIAGYSIGPVSSYEASAAIELLEHVQVVVALCIRGYRVTGGTSPSTSDTNSEFETLEALLQHHSPLYSAKRTELLFAKLSA